jgi:hypothetical protein
MLLENHVAGQRVIQIFQRPSVAEVTIGHTLLLVQNEDTPSEVSQYVRVIRVSSVEGTYTNADGKPYQAVVSTCDISDALRSNFAGSAPDDDFAAQVGKTKVRDTTVADAGAYVGVVGLKTAAVIGDRKAITKSVYTQLVPSAATETMALDINPSATRTAVLATTPRRVEIGVAPHTMRVAINQDTRGFNFVQILSPLPTPGTVEVAFAALGKWYSLLDDGAGALTGQGTGTVNYLNGTVSVTLPVLPDVASSLIYSWGEKLGYDNHSGQATYRAPEFSFDLTQKGIDPGSFTVTWLSASVLRTATANAAGVISGDATGYIAYTYGKVTLRPNHMLDAGGQFNLDYTWSPVEFETKAGVTASGGGMATFSTLLEPIPGSIMVEWMTTRSVSASGGSGLNAQNSLKSTNAGSSSNGSQLIQSKVVHHPASLNASVYGIGMGIGNTGYILGNLPAPAPTWTPAYDSVVSDTRYARTNVQEDTTDGTSSKLSTSSAQTSTTVVTTLKSITDNGVGGFLNGLGVVNYAGKTITLKVVDPSLTSTSYKNDTESASDFGRTQTKASNDPGTTVGWYTPFVPASSSSLGSSDGGSQSTSGGSYGTQAVSEVLDTTALWVTYRSGTNTATPKTETFTPGVVSIDIAPYTTNRVVPNSIQFTWMGHVYQDIDGVLYRDPAVGSAGTTAGVVDYMTGQVHVTDYVVNGSPSSFTLNSLWTSKGDWTTSKISCRTPTNPVKPGGFVMSILSVDGTQLIATADGNGRILGPHSMGQIDYQTGVVDLIFGDHVLDSSLTAEQKAEWWYAKAATQITSAGKVWKPWPVDPYSLRYNVVSYFYLPLDADILGLDPVRLPQDGRVPIFRPGGFAVVGHTGEITATVSASQVIDCARVRLSRVRVIDQTGAVVNTGYTTDLEAGTVTFTNVAGYNQPVTIQHRIEDMVQVSDVQITGELGFTRALTHDYPLGSFVSSALIGADLKSRVSILFDQLTWNSTWTDALVGNGSLANFNTTLAPIEVTNKGAITERWALQFTNSSTFNIIGEHVGVIGTGSINLDCDPQNPATGTPYFTVPALGWGAGWAVGNVLRFNTVGAMFPIWVVRTIQQGPNTGTEHSFTLLSRGDVDRP